MRMLTQFLWHPRCAVAAGYGWRSLAFRPIHRFCRLRTTFLGFVAFDLLQRGRTNLDDHARNHAILASGRQWRLNPAYDLMSLPVVALERRDLAMACGRFGRYANRTNRLSEHGRFLLDRAEATEAFDRTARMVREQWHAQMRRAGITEHDREAIGGAFLYDGLFHGIAGKLTTTQLGVRLAACLADHQARARQ